MQLREYHLHLACKHQAREAVSLLHSRPRGQVSLGGASWVGSADGPVHLEDVAMHRQSIVSERFPNAE
eukprot:5205437-Amphidinium_carterae.1